MDVSIGNSVISYLDTIAVSLDTYPSECPAYLRDDVPINNTLEGKRGCETGSWNQLMDERSYFYKLYGADQEIEKK